MLMRPTWAAMRSDSTNRRSGTPGADLSSWSASRIVPPIRCLPEWLSTPDAPTLTGFVHKRTKSDNLVFTEEARAYDHINRPHMTVKPSVKEFVNDMVRINGMESFSAVLRRAYVCIDQHMSARHLHRYVGEFTGRHNARPMDPVAQLALAVRNGDNRDLVTGGYMTLVQIQCNDESDEVGSAYHE